MKALKKQWLTLIMLAALVVTLTLGVIFALPAQSAVAAVDAEVGDAEALQNAINNAPDGVNYEIQLTDDISGNIQYFIDTAKDITIDLNGHLLESSTSDYFITNAGTLTLIDRKGGGLISISSDNGMPLLNYGTATLSVDITSMSTPISNVMASIKNEDEVYYTRYYRRPSLTIAGGTITCTAAKRFMTVNYFIKNLDGDLTISGGKFIGTNKDISSGLDFLDIESSTLEPFDPWFEPSDPEFLKDVEIRKNAEEAEELKALHKSVVRISGGDYTDLPLVSKIVVDKAIKVIAGYDRYIGNTFEQVGTEEISLDVEISGGKWLREYPEYTAEGSMFVQQTEYDTEGEIVSQYYTVDNINSDKIGVRLIADGKTLNFSSFETAWDHAIGEYGDSERVLELQKDFSLSEISLQETNGKIVIDLNGHNLKLEKTGTMTEYLSSKVGGLIKGSNNNQYKNTLVICDNSDRQDGELILSYRDLINNNLTGEGYILLSNSTDYSNTKFVLESGTIRQTGIFGADWYTKNDATTRRALALFKTGTIISKLPQEETPNDGNALVTIRGGNIISQLQFGEGESYVGTRTADLMRWTGNEFNFDGSSVEEKENIFALNYGAYFTENPTKTLKFSWNVSNQLQKDGLICSPVGEGVYIISKSVENAKFLASVDGVNVTDHETLDSALQALGESGGTVSALCSSEVSGDITIPSGVTLDLNRSDFELTFDGTLTLEDGARVRNGILSGNVIVAGNTASRDGDWLPFENVTVNGAVTIQADADLQLVNGVFNCTFEIAPSATIVISGGSFKGSEIEKLDPHFTQYRGAWKEAEASYENDTLYPVMIAPNLTVQKWYSENVKNNSLIIHTVEDWTNFALYVNSGVDNFAGKTVRLDGQASSAVNRRSAVSAAEKVLDFEGQYFLPAGNLQHGFAGIFDGSGTKFINIDAHELVVGLFGTVEGAARLNNITIENSSFKLDSGVLDELNRGGGFYSGAAIVGHGILNANREKTDMSGNFTLSGVSVDYNVNAIPSTGGMNWDANFHIGGIVGHSWGSVILDTVVFRDHCTVKGNWKTGGVVGYLDGEFYMKNADIEQGATDSDNGLIVEGGMYSAVLVGHAHNAKNTVEDCTILESKNSLFGSLYQTNNASEGNISIKGSKTELDIYRVVGGSRKDATVDIEITGEVTAEDGVQKGSFKTQEKENYLTFLNEKGEDITKEVKQNSDGSGGYTAKSELIVDVSIGGLPDRLAYTGEGTMTMTLTAGQFKLFDIYGNPVDEDYGEIEITVTLVLSQYNVGKQIALITSYTVSGANAESYNFLPVGNQAFIEVEVTARALTVRVNRDGSVSYEGFVNGEDESVLEGELHLERVDNGDGTSTVTPSGLTSANYVITFESGIVENEQSNNALWITLAVVGGVIAAFGAVAVVYAVRRKKN